MLSFADQSNGVQKVWLDQKLVMQWNNLRYSVNINSHKIERMVWQNFHGGKDQRFAPDMDQTQQYDPFLTASFAFSKSTRAARIARGPAGACIRMLLFASDLWPLLPSRFAVGDRLLFSSFCIV